MGKIPGRYVKIGPQITQDGILQAFGSVNLICFTMVTHQTVATDPPRGGNCAPGRAGEKIWSRGLRSG